MSRVLVLACGRADPGQIAHGGELHLEAMPCTGRISVPLLLASIAHGYHGVLVMGRHQRTCRFNGAEDLARRRVDQAAGILELLGLHHQRIQLVEPTPGRDGPRAAIEIFAEEIAHLSTPAGLECCAPPRELLSGEGLDSSLALVRWFDERLGGRGDNSGWLERNAIQPTAPDGPHLPAGEIPFLHLLGLDLFSPSSLLAPLSVSTAVMAAVGEPGLGVRLDGSLAANPYGLMDDRLRREGEALPRPPSPARVACDGSPEQSALLERLGYTPVDVGPDPLPEHFSWSHSERGEADERLSRAESRAAAALYVHSPGAHARWALATRQGAWRASRILPLSGVELAHRSLCRLPLSHAGGAAADDVEVES